MKALVKTIFSKQVLLFLPLLALTVLFAHMPDVFAADPGGLITDLDNPSRIAGSTQGEDSIRTLLLTFLDFFLGFLGLLAVLMVIYGGFLYLTAAGDESKTENGKKVILYSVVGIVVILLAFALVNTVLSGIGFGQDQ
ncbi:hypothetical protein HOG48_05460 [Candidatus Peregrinibacteria bacterium]|nr:hypothetical protein [Candidatus Peregrinibacteria bacterium]